MKRVLAITFVMLCSATASAQQKPDVSALEASGNKHFELAEYDAAISDFKEAFRVSDEPGFLYNIAQAYRLERNCRESAIFYKNYLRRVPNAPNAAKVRERITEMEKCAETQPVAPATPVQTTPTTTAQTPPPAGLEAKDEPEPAPAPNPRAWMKWAGIASLGVGAISGGLAIKFALDGKAADDDLAKLCATSCSGAQAKQVEDDGKAANRNAVIAGVAAGAFVGGGIVFLVLSRGGGSGETASEPEVSLAPTRGGATASYGWRF